MIRTLLFVSLVSCCIVFSGCSKNATPQSGSAVTNQHDNVAEIVSVTARPEKAPNFTWNDSTGTQVGFDNFHGKVTLVNFWATWCGPCKKELPDLVDLSKELSSKGFRVIGISTDRGSNVIDDVRSFVHEHGIPYQVLISNEQLEQAFGNVNMLPTSFIVDANGKIRESFVGMRTKEGLRQALQPYLD